MSKDSRKCMTEEELEELLQEAECSFPGMDLQNLKSNKEETQQPQKKVKRCLIGFGGGVTDEPIIKATKNKIGFDIDVFKR